jgi:type VI secretion system secreted protein Hcp
VNLPVHPQGAVGICAEGWRTSQVTQIPVEEDQMARNFSMTAEGTKQGKITGGPPRKGWEDLDCIGLEKGVEVGQGSGSGERERQPVTITKLADPASPKLFRALVTNEVLKTVKIYWSRDGSAKPSTWYITELTNAVIAKITRVSLPGVKGLCERVEFTYEKSETKIDFSRR